MRRSAITALVILAATTSPTFAAPEVGTQKTQASTKKEVTESQQIKSPAPAKAQVEAPASKPARYSTDRIDLNLQKLPPRYFGNDPKQVYSSLYAGAGALKGASEAAGSGKEGLFAFQAGDTSVAPEDKEFDTQARKRGIGVILPPDIRYSADNSEFEIALKLGNVAQGHGGKLFDENAQSAQLLDEVVRTGVPVASSADDATANVLKGVVNRYYAAVVNFKQPLFRYEKNWSGFHWTLRAKVKSPSDEADNMRILLIGSIEEPLTSSRSFQYEPKPNEPAEYSLNQNYIYLKVREVWIYNQATGHIYAKIKDGSHYPPDPEE